MVLKSITDVIARGVSLVTFPIVASHLGSAGFGKYALLMSLVSFVMPFASGGVPFGLVRFFSTSRWTAATLRRFGRVAGWSVLLATTVSVGLVLAAPSLGRLLLDGPRDGEVFRAGGALVGVATAEQLLLNLFQARAWFGAYSMLQLSQAVVTGGIVVGVLVTGGDLVNLLVVLAGARAAMVCAWAVLPLVRTVPSEGEPDETLPISTVVRYGFPLAIAAFGVWLVNLGDRLVIGYNLPTAALGRYSAIYTMAGLCSLASAPLFLPANTRLVRAAVAGDAAALADDVRLFHRSVSLTTIPVAVLLCIVVGPAVEILGGDDFAVGFALVALVVVGLFLDQWNGLAHYVLIGHGRTVRLQNLWLVSGGVNIVLNVALVPVFGLEGSAIATLLTFVGLEAAVFRSASQHAPMWRLYQWRTCARVLAGSLVAGIACAAVLAVQPAGVLALALAAVAFMLVLVPLLVLFGELRSSDWSVLVAAVGWRSIARR